MPQENALIYEKKVHAPVDLIYRAFTSSSALREWLCDFSTTNPMVGGRFYVAWENGYFASGHFTDLVPDKVVGFTWIGKAEPGWTRVKVTLTPKDEDVTLVKLVHNDLGEGPAWVKAWEEIDKGWKIGLRNLKSTLEEGFDIRITQRPLIGFYPEDLDPDESKQINVPVQAGVVVRDVVPGLGAEKAGLQPNDVLVAINGEGFNSIKQMSPIMSRMKVGEEITITFYRGEEKKTARLVLSALEVEDLPETPELLAKELEQRSSKLLDSLDQVLNGVTEAEASFSPGPDEWSVKEVLAHLIHIERENHIWINNLVSDRERFYESFPGENLFRLRAALVAYPTLNDLLAEFRRALKETVASVAFLDYEFTRRMPSYWRLGIELLTMPKHTKDHIHQIENNIRLARNSQKG